jgi:hypothetical protein
MCRPTSRSTESKAPSYSVQVRTSLCARRGTFAARQYKCALVRARIHREERVSGIYAVRTVCDSLIRMKATRPRRPVGRSIKVRVDVPFRDASAGTLIKRGDPGVQLGSRRGHRPR